MSISISRATADDIVDIVNVRAAAYANSKLHQHGLPGPMTDEQSQEYRQYQLDTMNKRFGMPGRNYFKAVDDSNGRIVGFSCWDVPEDQENDIVDRPSSMPELPAFVNKKMFNDIGKKFKEAKAQIVGERTDFWCKVSSH